MGLWSGHYFICVPSVTCIRLNKTFRPFSDLFLFCTVVLPAAEDNRTHFVHQYFQHVTPVINQMLQLYVFVECKSWFADISSLLWTPCTTFLRYYLGSKKRVSTVFMGLFLVKEHTNHIIIFCLFPSLNSPLESRTSVGDFMKLKKLALLMWYSI